MRINTGEICGEMNWMPLYWTKRLRGGRATVTGTCVRKIGSTYLPNVETAFHFQIPKVWGNLNSKLGASLYAQGLSSILGLYYIKAAPRKYVRMWPAKNKMQSQLGILKNLYGRYVIKVYSNKSIHAAHDEIENWKVDFARSEFEEPVQATRMSCIFRS